jgi:hypothetical protein
MTTNELIHDKFGNNKICLYPIIMVSILQSTPKLESQLPILNIFFFCFESHAQINAPTSTSYCLILSPLISVRNALTLEPYLVQEDSIYSCHLLLNGITTPAAHSMFFSSPNFDNKME